METVSCSQPVCAVVNLLVLQPAMNWGEKQVNFLMRYEIAIRWQWLSVTKLNGNQRWRASEPIHSPWADHVWLPYYVLPRISLHLKMAWSTLMQSKKATRASWSLDDSLFGHCCLANFLPTHKAWKLYTENITSCKINLIITRPFLFLLVLWVVSAECSGRSISKF